MARYDYEFVGIPARFVEPRGMDPNYREGYQGMRMHGRHGSAPYGVHRLVHPHDLEAWGGFDGIHDGTPRPGRNDWDWGEGQGHYEPRSQRLIREFNSNSPALHRGVPSADDLRASLAPERSWAVPRDYRPGYGNRGLSDGGYGESWADFPMRGGR